MSKRNVMSRLEKVLARVESPEEGEARTAALMAFRLLKEHRIDLVWVNGRMDLRWHGEPSQPPPHRPFVQSPKKPPEPRTATPYVAIRSRFNGFCKACGNKFFRGDQVLSGIRQNAVTCAFCVDYWS